MNKIYIDDVETEYINHIALHKAYLELKKGFIVSEFGSDNIHISIWKKRLIDKNATKFTEESWWR